MPLIVLVILGGLLLGGLLTRFFGNTGGTHEPPSAAPSFTPLPEASQSPVSTFTPVPSASPTGKPKPAHSPMPTAKPSEKPSVKPSAKPSETPTPTPAATASARPSAKPKAAPKTPPPVIIITPAPTPKRTPTRTAPPAPPTVAPAVTATPVLITGGPTREHAGAIVRAYIDALANGNSATATGYLANGIPNESFLNPNVTVSIAQLRTARNDDGSFTVTAQIETSKGNYLEAFALRQTPYGLQITDHNATRE